MTKNKARFVFVLMVMGFTLGGMLLDPAENTLADANQLGPFTEIQMPLEDLPALNEDLVYQPVLDVETLTYVPEGVVYSEQIGAKLQILYVLEDPREVPLARYASNTESGVVLPDGDLINQDNLKTISVFVRLEATHKTGTDPILASDVIDLHWPALYVVPLSFEMKGVPRFPCAPVEYADGTPPYQLPAGIDGGDAVGGDGLYDPAAYAPPKPWYYGEDPVLEQGEVREGWISCLAPDIPLEQLQIKYRRTFIPKPEIALVANDRNGFRPYPENSEVEVIGLTADDIPLTITECEAMDHCIEVDAPDLRNCTFGAQEAGLEQGVCVSHMFGSNVDEDAIIASSVFYTIKNEEPTQQSYLLWNYSVNKLYPVSLIRIDDIILTFMDEYGNLLKDRGAVVFNNPILDYSATGAYVSELDSQVDHEYDNEILDGDDYALFSRVVVEPDNLSREDVGGYQLNEIGVTLNTLVDHEGVRLYSGNDNLEINRDFLQPSDPFEGIIYSGIGSKSVDKEVEEEFRYFGPKGYGSLRPGSALIGIHPVPEDILSLGGPAPRFHPISVITMFKPNLVANTTMCDVVDCVDMTIPRYDPGPSRTVPVMCAGEWANNFIIDSGDLVPVMYHIGEAWGLGYTPGDIHSGFDATWFENAKVLLYDGRVMGGSTSWWLYATPFDGQFGSIAGHTIDLQTGDALGNRTYVTHYYGRVDRNDLSEGYFAPVEWQPLSNKGWIVGIADEKVLIFGTISAYEDERFEVLNDRNTGFLFHEEGPIWVTECSRPTIPALTDPELYAQTNLAAEAITEEGEHIIKELLPGMDYPPALPVIREEVLSLGEYTDPVSRGNYRVATKNIKIIPGKPDVPVVYIASEDKYYPAEKNPNFNNEVFFQRSGAVVIPPDTSYVRVKIAVDYIDNGDLLATTSCSLREESFQLVYAGYLPITGISDRGRDPKYPCDYYDYSTWINFLFPSLEVDPDMLLLSVRTNGKDPWFFLKLTE